MSATARDRLVRYLVALGARPDLLQWAEGLEPAPLLTDLPALVTRGDWRAWLIERSGVVSHEALVAALADVVRVSLLYVPRGEPRPLRAVEAAEAYARHRVSEAALRDAAQASADISVSIHAPEWAARMLAFYALDGAAGPASRVDAQGVVRLAATAIYAARRARADALPGKARSLAYECALERVGVALEGACKTALDEWSTAVGLALVYEARRALTQVRARSRTALARLTS